MRVLVLHNIPDQDAAVEAHDVLTQRDAVMAALASSSIQARSLGVSLDLEVVRREIEEYAPDVVFNLVESLAETDRLMSLVPLLLDALQIPYTGATSAAILATGNKLAAKYRFKQAGLPTPPWSVSTASTRISNEIRDFASARVDDRTRWIIKPVWEHASIGMGDHCVVVVRDQNDLDDRLNQAERQTGRPMMAERYIEGREFNLSLLSGEVLPPAEIDFSAFPPGKPRIVGHAAKWDENSFEYQQTPRRFDFPGSDAALLDSLRELSAQCWEDFALTGFARVDFRVDDSGQPWILEVNVNPCLSPDAGFAAALSVAGIDFADAILRIVQDACTADRSPIRQVQPHQMTSGNQHV